jgi:hypothetical protein
VAEEWMRAPFGRVSCTDPCGELRVMLLTRSCADASSRTKMPLAPESGNMYAVVDEEGGGCEAVSCVVSAMKLVLLAALRVDSGGVGSAALLCAPINVETGQVAGTLLLMLLLLLLHKLLLREHCCTYVLIRPLPLPYGNWVRLTLRTLPPLRLAMVAVASKFGVRDARPQVELGCPWVPPWRCTPWSQQ